MMSVFEGADVREERKLLQPGLLDTQLRRDSAALSDLARLYELLEEFAPREVRRILVGQ